MIRCRYKSDIRPGFQMGTLKIFHGGKKSAQCCPLMSV